jgi:hypothetical protein
MAARVITVAALACLMSVAGCGAKTDARQAESQPGTDSPTTESSVVFGGWGTEMAEPEFDEPVTLTDELAVFSRPRQPADMFPTTVIDHGSDSAEGRELGGQTRLLLAGVSTEDIDELGPQRLSLYGVPTDRGWVCAYIVYDDLGELAVGGACEHGLVEGLGLELHGDGPLYRLYGVVENGIERAWIQVGERRLPARIGGNGIYFEAKATEVCPTEIEALVVERADGEVKDVPWGRLAPAIVGSPRPSFGCR